MNPTQSFLFESESDYTDDLENRAIPHDLRDEFELNRVPLSQNVDVEIKAWKDSRWLITDKDREQTYAARMVGDSLTIYEANTEHHILEIEMLSGLYKGQRLVLRNIVNHSMPLLSIPATPGRCRALPRRRHARSDQLGEYPPRVWARRILGVDAGIDVSTDYCRRGGLKGSAPPAP